MKNGCSKGYIKNIYNETEVNINKLQEINMLQNKLKKYTESRNLEKILNLNMKQIEDYSRDYSITKNNGNISCKLDPGVCEINIKIEESKLEKLKEELKEKISLHNNDLSVIEKLKQHYLRGSEKSTDIYLNFGRDKNNDLIALYFDVEKFINSKHSTVYLFSKHQEYLYPSKLFLKYEYILKYRPKRYNREKNNGYALIGDFRVVEKRIGHGTFMLSNIESILKEVNKNIRYKNRNIDYDDRDINEIVAVNGMLSPGSDTTYDDLVKFYNKNGYPTYDSDNIKNRNLYKEI